MTIPRTLAGVGLSAALIVSLTACFQLPIPNQNGGNGGNGGQQTEAPADGVDLADTTWSGTDSDGDEWNFEFQGDNTLAFTYNGNSYDDATDTWELDGDQLSMHIAFNDGDMDFSGTVESADAPIDLDGTYPGGTFTLTITRD
jgi:hypothetical protein